MLRRLLPFITIVIFLTGVCTAASIHQEKAVGMISRYDEIKGLDVLVDDPVRLRITGNTIRKKPRTVQQIVNRLNKWNRYFSSAELIEYKPKSGRVWSFEIQAIKAEISPVKADPDAYQPDASAALVSARRFLSDRMNSPNLEFPFFEIEKEVAYLGGRKYIVSSFYDIQNLYGAKVRKPYTVRVREGTDGYWYMEGMDF